jgi:type II secretory pathway component PulM
MKDWFANLEAREQAFVAGGALVVVIALIYALLWLPFDKNHRQLVSSVDDWQRSLAELGPLRSLAGSGQSSRPRNIANAQQAPIIIVDQTLRGRGLEQYRRRSQPTTSNGVRVEFEAVAFDELVLWLGDLSDEFGMHVQAGSVSAVPQAGAGRVNASLTLERGL